MADTLTRIQVSGTYQDPNRPDFPVAGKIVQFVPNAKRIMNAAGATICVPQTLNVVLDDSGAFSVPLIATDDPAGTPTGWTYTVKEPFGTDPYPILVPFDSPGLAVDLVDIAPAAAQSGGTVQLVGGIGITGVSLTPDNTALVFDMSDGSQQTSPALPYATTSSVAGKANSSDLTAEIANRITAVDAKANAIAGVIQSNAVVGSSDQASVINTELSALPTGGTLQLPTGTVTIHSPITVPAGATLRNSAGTVLTNTVATTSAVILNAGSALIGGSINSPATFDGTTGGTWTYAVVYITGTGATVSGVTLNNVPHIGIGVKDTDDAVIVGCRIFGNYPSASFTGTQTAHFGINFDPGTSVTGGNVVIGQNIVKTCVQGTFVGNHGAGGNGRGVAVVGNVYESCWNHGVYADQGEGYTITGNSFNRCQNPVVISGTYHTVVGNTMTTASTGTGADEPQISVRDAIGCVVSGNTLQGEANGSTGVMIDVRELVGVELRDNIIANNIVDVTGSTGATAIRVGQGSATIHENNTVTGNHVRSAGVATTALIGVYADPSILGMGNKVIDNTITIAGGAYGITLSSQTHADVRGNHIRLEYNAGSAVTLGGVVLTNGSVKNRIKHNDFVCAATFGTNVTFRGVWETSASGSGFNRVGPNDYDLDPTLLTTAAPLFLLSGSGTIIDESGAGAPTAPAGVGSIWRRTDGGSSTTLYLKESGTTSSGWNPASSASAATPTNVQTFTTVGTTSWTKPSGAVMVRAEVIGGGPGGGSGRRGAAGSVRCGGGGGGGAARSDAMVNASDLPSTVTVVVGAAGTGGAAITADSTDGNAGGAGGDSRFGDTVGGIQVYARTGNPGGGGTASAGSGGAVSIGMFPGANGGAASTTGGVGVAGGATGTTGAGGSGGGVTSADAASNGGTGSVSSFSNTRTVTAAGTVGAGQNGAAGSAAPAAGMGGDGGGGGASSITGAAGTGGAGGIYGAGGGGGGASLNGNNSGAGGAGGQGFVRVTTYF